MSEERVDYTVKIPCPNLDCDNGIEDTGGNTPDGQPISLLCHVCHGRHYIDVDVMQLMSEIDQLRADLAAERQRVAELQGERDKQTDRVLAEFESVD